MIELERLSKSFGNVHAVRDLTLHVERGELLTLLGPSGCGKTTTLRMIGGFETPTSGRIIFDGVDVTAKPPQSRGAGMVFQSYALFPHLNVFENVAFGLQTRKHPRAEIATRVRQALDLVQLGDYGERRVQELSGGQQQRVALARALAPEPPIILLDEPLSNLDAALRERTRVELRTLLKRLGLTAVFVTHDQEEAFAIADRVAVLDRGELQQLGSPEDLYHRPVNPFVAGFIGRANFIAGTVEQTGDQRTVCRLENGALWECAAPQPLAQGQHVRIMARPEQLEIVAQSDACELEGELVARRFAGSSTFLTVKLATGELQIETRSDRTSWPERVCIRPLTTPIAYPAQAQR